MQSKFWFLKRIKLFSSLKDEELNDLDKITKMEEIKRRQPIYLPGDPANTVYLLKAGRVKISRVTEDGKEFTLAILEPGEVFGELEAWRDLCEIQLPRPLRISRFACFSERTLRKYFKKTRI